MRKLRQHPRIFLRPSVFLLALIVTAPPLVALRAQTSAGTIHGHIADSTGAITPNVPVVAHRPAVGGVFQVMSDAEGNYRLADLPQGTEYVVEAETSGFQKFVRVGLLVRPGLDVTVDISLIPGSQSDSVQVSGDAPLIDTQSAEQSVNLSGELLRNVPITGRHDWSDSLQLTPGIISASSDASGGQTYFLRGSENENHAALLDGMDVGSFQQNWPSNVISVANESLGDIQIKTGANDASSPAAMGMVINLASPSGSDNYHGSVFYLIGPATLNGNNVPNGNAAASATQQPDFHSVGQSLGIVHGSLPLAATFIGTMASVRRVRRQPTFANSCPGSRPSPINRAVSSFLATPLSS